jgi:hypothetical protein
VTLKRCRCWTFGATCYGNPLSQFGKPYTAPKPEVGPSWDLKRSPVDLIEKMSAQQYFWTLWGTDEAQSAARAGLVFPLHLLLFTPVAC